MPRGGKREGSGRKSGEQDKPRQHITNQARKHSEKALSVLLQLLADESPSIRLQAAKEIMDRAHGKPAQSIQHSGDEDKPINHSLKVEFIGNTNT